MAFCTSTTPIPAECSVVGTTPPPKEEILTPRKSIALDSLHLQLALDSLLVSRSHCKESLQGVLQGVMARSHCKESLQGVIARSHCKESLQGVMRAIASCKEPSAWSQVQVASARYKCKEPSARSQVQGAKCVESSASCKCNQSSASCKCKESSASCKCKESSASCNPCHDSLQ